MKQFGVLTNTMDSSQKGLMITHSLNSLVQTRYDICPTIFYREYCRSATTPLFPMMQDAEAWNFTHPVFSTDLASTERLIGCPCVTQKFFYVMDLEWMYQTYVDYDYLSHIYNHQDIKLIARCDEHFKALRNCWQTPVAVIEDFNYEEILNLLNYKGN